MSKQTKTVLYQKHLDYITPLMWNGARSVSFSRFCQRLRDGRTIKKAIETPADLNRCSKDKKKAPKIIKSNTPKEDTTGTNPAANETPTETPKDESKQIVTETTLNVTNKIYVPRDLSRVDKVRGWIGVFVLAHFAANAIATIYELILAAAK